MSAFHGSSYDSPFDTARLPPWPPYEPPDSRRVVPPGSAGPGQQGQRFAKICTALAAVLAIVLAVAGFLMFNSVDVISPDPLGSALGWLTVFCIAAVAALVVIGMSGFAVARCRPRAWGVVAILAAVLLPTLAVWLAVNLGVPALKANAVAELGSEVEALRALEAAGVPVESLPGLLDD